MIISLLKNNIDVLVTDPNKIKVEKFTCLPDDKKNLQECLLMTITI